MAFCLRGGNSHVLAQAKFKPKYLREDNKAFKDLTSRATDDGWIEFRKDKPKINPTTFFETFGSELGLDQHYQFRLVKDKADVKQNRHQHFQLFYKNIRVEGIQYSLHSRDGGLQVAHGRIPDGLAIDVSKPIQERVALTAALAEEKLTLDDFKGSTKLPKGELVLKPTSGEVLAENVRLAYLFQINLNQVYVDAVTGKVIGKFSLVQFDNLGGNRKVQANTPKHSSNPIESTLLGGSFTHFNNRYPGGQRTQSFETEEHDQGGFRLTMSTPNRVSALETQSDNNGNGVIFNNGQIADIVWGDDPVVINATNNWGTSNQSATTAHWIIWRAYEYFRGFGINNLGVGGQIARVLVNTNINDNAFFTVHPLDGLAYVYVGTSGTNPTQGFSVVDILGHEYGHGISRVLVGGNGLSGNGAQFAEARALNEGFSDIFGIATERQLMPSEWNWTVGEDLNNPVFVRNPANPATSGGGNAQFAQPSTYQGTNWDFSPNTSGHINSGVLSHWFYLINHWGSTPVSFKDAMDIVILALDGYMVNSSNYLDARNATIAAAKDLFGNCSPQEKTLVEVWQHVGLGYSFQYACASACDYQASLSGPNTVSPGQSVQLSASCSPNQFNACSNIQFSLNSQTPTSNSTFSFNAPSGAGFYTYTVGLSKAGCNTKTATKTIQVSGNDPCNFSSGPRRVGTWNGLEVQIRQYPNGKRALVTAIIGSPTDKHYPRGDNFWDVFTKDAGVEGLQGCLNAGQSGWYGLTYPGGLSPASGYVQGTEPDGAVFFQQNGVDPCDFSGAPRTVGTWNGLTVQIRQYPGQKRALVTAVNGSSSDKHYPRGDNFWDNFTKDPGVDGLRGCLNAGESGWYGLTFPTGISPNPGYLQGNESDGATYFQLSGGSRIATTEKTAEDVALVKVRPNPVQDEVTVQFTLSKPQTVTLRIVDLQGRPLQKHSHEGVAGRNEKTLNVSSLTTGIYALEVVLENQRVIHKLLKQ